MTQAVASGPRIGSLFSGYDGLDEATRLVLGGSVAFVADVCKVNTDGTVGHHDPHQAPCSILAHVLPDVPNLGDVAAIDWHAVLDEHGPIQVLTAGFPCQDVSHAGKQAGLLHGTRTGLWHEVVRAITVLRPELVFLENVRGLLTAKGDTSADLERAEVRVAAYVQLRETMDARRYRLINLGRTEDAQRMAAREHRRVVAHRRALADLRRAERRVVRAVGTVLGALADVGYDATWCGLPASRVGAPHGRFRIFIAAVPNGSAGNTDGP